MKYEGSGVYLKQKQSLTLCSREEIKFTNVTFRNNSVMKTGFGGIAFHSINFMVTDYLYHRSPQYFVILDSCTENVMASICMITMPLHKKRTVQELE